jgi:WD40 repeat protein
MSITNISYNECVSHLTVGTTFGFIIYSLNPSIQKKIYEDKKGGVNMIKILKRTNVCVLTGGGEESFKSDSICTTKNTVVLWDNHEQKVIMQIDCGEPIKNVHIHQNQLIVVVLDTKVLIFNFESKAINTKQTYMNVNGVSDITYGSDPIVGTLGNRKGEICIWKLGLDSQKTINAHEGNIECLSLSRDGSMVATASERGTLLRVFNTETGKKLYEFRRGTNPVHIHSIGFSWNNKLLACTSGNGTVHLFDLYIDAVETQNTQSMFYSLKDYLPGWVSSEWSFKQHTLNTYAKSICAFDDTDTLHIVTYDGNYFKVCSNNWDNISSTDLLIGSK